MKLSNAEKMKAYECFLEMGSADAILLMNAFQEVTGKRFDWHEFSMLLDQWHLNGLASINNVAGQHRDGMVMYEPDGIK